MFDIIILEADVLVNVKQVIFHALSINFMTLYTYWCLVVGIRCAILAKADSTIQPKGKNILMTNAITSPGTQYWH